MFRKMMKKACVVAVLVSSTMLAGCEGSVGVGLNVGIPIGNHGYMSVGTSRWY